MLGLKSCLLLSVSSVALTWFSSSAAETHVSGCWDDSRLLSLIPHLPTAKTILHACACVHTGPEEPPEAVEWTDARTA